MRVAIIGGGAAGFFAAISVRAHHPEAAITLYEKSDKLLSKVKVSGGGRCNVTNGCPNIKSLIEGYPRGSKQLKKAFKVFNNKDTWEWFESRGVALKTEPDNRVFPQSNSSQTVINCLMGEAEKGNITIKTGHPVTSIRINDDKILLEFRKQIEPPTLFDKVVVATGGSPKASGLDWLVAIDHQIENPVPSLFTFNMPNEVITKLMGVVAPEAMVAIQSTKLKSVGPLLITHWGMSGPAILKLSALGARVLSELNYEFSVQVNWINQINNELVKEELFSIVKQNAKKKLSSIRPFNLPNRLWSFLLEKVDLPLEKPWQELGKKGINKLVNILTHDIYQVKGKTTFKEEFVTCGGISLDSVHFKTMQSKHCPNLYFAGEILDIDGITGGYNFQAAWTTGFIAGKLNTV